jgi:hypothetical protein
MVMKNSEIYTTAKNLLEAFADSTQYLPVRLNFFITKNKNTLLALGQDIDNARIQIIQNYGTLDVNTNQYNVPVDKIEEANRELADLFNIEQDIHIDMISIDNFPPDICLTTGQMNALMFMIE